MVVQSLQNIVAMYGAIWTFPQTLTAYPKMETYLQIMSSLSMKEHISVEVK